MAASRKRQRTDLLQNLLHTGDVTTRALVAIVSKIREHPEHMHNASRHILSDANLERFMQLRHVEPLDLRDGTTFNWEFCEPNRMLASMVHECSPLEELFIKAANEYPCSANQPWSLIIGFDEYTPGNKLSVHNERKCRHLSFNLSSLARQPWCMRLRG